MFFTRGYYHQADTENRISIVTAPIPESEYDVLRMKDTISSTTVLDTTTRNEIAIPMHPLNSTVEYPVFCISGS